MYHWTVIWSCIDCRLKNKVMHERTGVCEIPVPISSQNQKWGGTHTHTHTPWAVIHNQMIIFLSSLPVLMVCKNKSSLHSCSSGRVNQAANFLESPIILLPGPSFPRRKKTTKQKIGKPQKRNWRRLTPNRFDYVRTYVRAVGSVRTVNASSV